MWKYCKNIVIAFLNFSFLFLFYFPFFFFIHMFLFFFFFPLFFSSIPFPYLYLPFSFFFCSLTLGLSSLQFALILFFSSSTPLVLSTFLFFFFFPLCLLHWWSLHFFFFLFFSSSTPEQKISLSFSLSHKQILSHTHIDHRQRSGDRHSTQIGLNVFFFVLIWLVLFYCSDFIRLMRKIFFVFQIFWLGFVFCVFVLIVVCFSFLC